MSKTLVELETEAFGILTGLDPSQTPATEDLNTIEVYVDPLVTQLSADGIVTISDTDDIPDEFFLPLARLLANVAGPRYGSPMNPEAKLADERALRRLTAAKPTYEPMKADYF